MPKRLTDEDSPRKRPLRKRSYSSASGDPCTGSRSPSSFQRDIPRLCFSFRYRRWRCTTSNCPRTTGKASLRIPPWVRPILVRCTSHRWSLGRRRSSSTFWSWSLFRTVWSTDTKRKEIFNRIGIFRGIYTREFTGVQSTYAHTGHLSVLHGAFTHFFLERQWESSIVALRSSMHFAVRILVPPPQVFEHY